VAEPAKRVTRQSVEYNVTEHCNLSCYGCDHASPLLPEKFAAIEDFSRDFSALARVYHAEELRILGGEPLLHPDLLEFLREGRRIGIADSIWLYTNGVLLHTMPEELWELIDGLHLSAYPGVRRRLDDAQCARLCEAHGVKLDLEHYTEFTRTLVNQRIRERKLVTAIYQHCRMAVECNTVHEGRFYKCAPAPFMGPRLALQGIDFDNRAQDGVPLHDNPTLRDDLESYLNAPTPLAGCSYCLGTSGPLVPHRQLDRKGCNAWQAENNRADIKLVREQLLGRHWLLRGVGKLRRLLTS
jgi:MoaA/NifB/PqqE/SkfB family radical SAM enzyme